MGSTRRFRNSVGPQVRKLRIAQDLSQDDLATKLQLAGLPLDRAAVGKIEARIRSVFDFELAIIAGALGVATDRLLPPKEELIKILPALLDGHIPSKRKRL